MPARRNLLLAPLVFIAFICLFSGPVLAVITFNISPTSQTGDEFTLTAEITGLTSCTDGTCYLQAMFTLPDKSDYFGHTQDNQGNWFAYKSPGSAEDVTKTFFTLEPIEGSWSGKLKVKNQPESSAYQGPGTYSLKVRRYSGASKSHAGESNSLNVILNTALSSPDPTSAPTAKATTTPSPTGGSNSNANNDNSSDQSDNEPTPTPIGKVAGLTTTKKNKTSTFPADLRLSLDSASDSASFAALLLTPPPELVTNHQSSWVSYTIYSGLGLTSLAVVWILSKSYNRVLLWTWLKSFFG